MSGASTFLLFLRVGFSLAVVLGMIWGVARFAKRRGRPPTRGSDAHLDVVARRQMGRRGSLVVVETAGHTLLVGVTDTSISLLADLSGDAAATQTGTGVETGGTSTEFDASSVLDASSPVVVETGSPVVADLRMGDLRGVERRESLMDALRDLTVRRT